MLSPVPPPAIKNGGSHSKGKLRTTFVPEPAEPSTPHSTDDPYPSPSPPPRSPSFASPISLSRSSHTLSLCLFTPNGYTISSGNRKTISRESPEMNGISYADPIGRSRSNSNGSWGEYALQNSPQKSPITDFHQSRDSSPRKSPLSSAAGTGTGTDSPIDVSAYQESTDSSRVKQFLFHRDRDRARKAQLLYPSIGGHTADITQDWDDYEYGGGGADHKTPGKRDSPPGSSNRKTTLSRRGSGSSSGARQQRPNLYLHSSRSAGKSPAERSITVDLVRTELCVFFL